MKRPNWSSFGLLCLLCPAFSQRTDAASTSVVPDPNDPVIAEEISFWRGYGKEDYAGLAAKLMPDYVNVSDVVRTREEYLALTPSCVLDRFDLADSKVTRPNPTTALIVYRLNYSLTCDHVQTSRKTIATTVWILRDSRWLAQVHTETPTTSIRIPGSHSPQVKPAG